MKSFAPSSTSDLISPGSIGVAVALTGSVAGMLSPLGFPFLAIGVGLVCIGAIVSAPEADLEGSGPSGWWRMIALAALACLVGAGVAVLIPAVGQALVIVGSVVVATVAVFTLPLGSRRGARPD